MVTNQYLNRAKIIVRSKLGEQSLGNKGGLYDSANLMKEHLLRKSGKEKLGQIDDATWEKLLGELEKLAPQQCAEFLIFGGY